MTQHLGDNLRLPPGAVAVVLAFGGQELGPRPGGPLRPGIGRGRPDRGRERGRRGKLARLLREGIPHGRGHCLRGEGIEPGSAGAAFRLAAARKGGRPGMARMTASGVQSPKQKSP